MSDVNRIYADRCLAEIIPLFLANKQLDMAKITACLKEKDYATIEILGHRMKGSGAGYGFLPITEMGGFLEKAAQKHEDGEIERLVCDLSEYLSSVEVVYEEKIRKDRKAK